MMTVWSLTITGVVLIAVEVGGWPYDKTFIMQVVGVLKPCRTKRYVYFTLYRA